ncbi:uncharacterized protein Fot_18387 [Forsythia ovata]|uniref:Uncharacterized protein n=1 Tax=Forsythia ovata TaxID=205694 RepID=A0ABD1VI27_9LAMI
MLVKSSSPCDVDSPAGGQRDSWFGDTELAAISIVNNVITRFNFGFMMDGRRITTRPRLCCGWRVVAKKPWHGDLDEFVNSVKKLQRKEIPSKRYLRFQHERCSRAVFGNFTFIQLIGNIYQISMLSMLKGFIEPKYHPKVEEWHDFKSPKSAHMYDATWLCTHHH